jgi:hypothetical protein
MSFRPTYSVDGSLHDGPGGALHITNRTNAALKMKDYMVNKSGNLKPIRDSRIPILRLFIYNSLVNPLNLFDKAYSAQGRRCNNNEHKKTNP